MTNMNSEFLLTDIKFTGEGWKFGIPLVLMCIDIVSGIVHAWATGHLKSYRMREGLMRKFAEVSILAIGVLFECGLGLPSYIMSGFSIYIIFMELVSICENLKKMGVPIPRFVENAFRSMDEKIQNGESTNLTDVLKDSEKEWHK